MRKRFIGLLSAAVMAVSSLGAVPVMAQAVTIITEDTLQDLEDLNNVNPGTNMNNATLIPVSTRVRGSHQPGSDDWLAFTTGQIPEAYYVVSVVNKTQNSEDLAVTVYDEKGNSAFSLYSTWAGGFHSNYAQLQPNSTYYIKITNRYNYNNPTDYMLLVREAYSMDAVSVPDDGNSLVDPADPNIYIATNADDASYLPLGTKIQVGLEDQSRNWYAFTTDVTSNTTYTLSVVNMSPDSEDLVVMLLDSYDQQHGTINVSNSGTVVSLTAELIPETTYYIYIKNRYNNGGKTTDYTLVVEPE